MRVWRPCDAVETAVAWRDAIERRDGPTSLVLTRQGVPHQGRTAAQVAAIRRGGYVLRDCDGAPEIIFIATGSEVALAVGAAQALAGEGRAARVVSMPCVECFDAEPDEWRESVLPSAVTARVTIEAGVTETWWRMAGARGRVIGMNRFGESAPAKQLFEHFGFTVDHVTGVARELLAN
jgi:transketolase